MYIVLLSEWSNAVNDKATKPFTEIKKKDYPKIRWGGGHSKMFLVEGKAIIDMDTNVT